MPEIQRRMPPGMEWLAAENASVLDSPLTKAMRSIFSLLGGDDPTSQVLGLMTTEVPGPPGMDRLKQSIGGLVEKAKASITAYHGSPHDFERFSLEKIGTGEGAQAYGHGLYFAENEAVAKQYADDLGFARRAKEPASAAGVTYPPGTDRHRALLDVVDVGKEKALGRLDADIRFNRDYAPDRAAMQQTVRDWLASLNPEQIKAATKGKTYEVAIQADPEDFLDWDKPLSQQSEKVRRLVAESVPQAREPVVMVGDQPFNEWSRLHSTAANDVAKAKFYVALKQSGGDVDAAVSALRHKMTGSESQAYRDAIDDLEQGLRPVKKSVRVDTSGIDWRMRGSELVTQQKTTAPELAQTLRSAGLPGIKYLDQGSRSTGEGTRNYVVFDDALIEIKRKYAWLLPVLGAPAFDAWAKQQASQQPTADATGEP